MRVVKLLFLFVVLVLLVGALDVAYEGFYRKASYLTEAIYKVPNSSIEIVLERRGIHLFLAEFERMLVVRVGTKELIRKEVAVDTGGYCRMNIYQIGPTKYFLAGELDFDKYFLDVSSAFLTNEDGPTEKPSDAMFLGSFDRDDRGWRFIPAHERPEQKSKN